MAIAASVLGNITEEAYDSLVNVNVKGLLFTIQNALPLMPDGGSIILNASIAASKGIANLSVYSQQKPLSVHSRAPGQWT